MGVTASLSHLKNCSVICLKTFYFRYLFRKFNEIAMVVGEWIKIPDDVVSDNRNPNPSEFQSDEASGEFAA